MLQLVAKSFFRAIVAVVILGELLPIIRGRTVIISEKQREAIEVHSRSGHLPPSYSDASILRATFCENCFVNGDLLVCRQTFLGCFMQYPSSPMTDHLSLKARSALITSCTQHISDTYGSSILCSGLQALQTCRTKILSGKCAVYDRQMVIATGITIHLIQTLRYLLTQYTSPESGREFKRYSNVLGKSNKTKRTTFGERNVSLNGDLRSSIIHGFEPLRIRQGRANTTNKKIVSKVYLSCELLDHNGTANSSAVSDGEEPSESDHRFPPGECPRFDLKGPERLPAAIQIMIKGKELSRSEIIRRAVRKLRNRQDFRKVFEEKITVRTIKKGDVHHLVTFLSCPFDEFLY